MSKTYINIQYKNDRTIALIDMDCFYCQVEEKLNPNLKGKAIAVVQYNAWKGGGIIAVNYVARDKGVTRHMRGDEATEHCPEIVLCAVPSVRGKADLTKYREAGKEVAACLQKFTPLLERASVDEAYLDISELVKIKLKELNEGTFQLQPQTLKNSFAVGYENFGLFVKDISKIAQDSQDICENYTEEEKLAFKKSDIKLLIGAAIVNEIRAEVKAKTGYDCSAGIAHNKILAKLTAGMNKPNKQTVLPLRKIPLLFSTLPIGKVKGLGGKFGENVCEKFKIKFMSELSEIPEMELQKHFEDKNGSWLYLISRGIDLECVTPKYISKSIGCCKRFPGRNAISGVATLTHWLTELATEIFERLEKDVLENNRTSKLMTVSYTQEINTEDVASTRSVPLPLPYDQDRIVKDAFEAIKRNTEQFAKADNTNMLNNAIKFLGISCSKFENNPDVNQKNKLQALFNNHSKKGDSESAVSGRDSPVASSSTNLESTTEKKNVEPKGNIISFFKNHSKNTIENIPAVEDSAVKEVPVVADKKPERSNISSFFKTSKNDANEEESTEVEPMEDVAVTDIVEKINVPENSIELPPDENSVPFEDPAQIDSSESTSPITETKMDAIACSSTAPNTSKHDSYRQTYVEFQCPPNLELLCTECTDCKKKVPEFELQQHMDAHFAFMLSQQQREEFRKEIKNKIISPINSSRTNPKNKNRTKTKPSNANIGSFLVKQIRFSVEEQDSSHVSTTKNKKPTTHMLLDSFLLKQSRAKDEEEPLLPADDDIIIVETQPDLPIVISPEKSSHATISIGTEECEECHKVIPLQNFIEHMDFHVAQKAQLEWNQQNLIVSSSRNANGNGNAKPCNNNNNNSKRKHTSPVGSNVVKVRSLTSYFSKES